MKTKEKDIVEFIGKAVYDNDGQLIFRENKGGLKQFLDVRGWGAISNAFKNTIEAAQFQDDVGEWVVGVINKAISQSTKEQVMTKEFGNKRDGVIITVNESKLTLNYIEQIRNYLNVRETELKSK